MSNVELRQISLLMQTNYTLETETEHKAQGVEGKSILLNKLDLHFSLMYEKYAIHVSFHGYRNPEQASGKKEKKHSKSSLQWTLGNRGTLSYTFFTTVLFHVSKRFKCFLLQKYIRMQNHTSTCKGILMWKRKKISHPNS